MKQLPIFILFLFYLISCTEEKTEETKYKIDSEELEEIKIQVPVNRLEKELFEVKSADDMEKILIKYPQTAKKFFGVKPSDKEGVRGLFDFYTNKSLKEFYLTGEKLNNGFPDLEKSLHSLYEHIKYFYPEYKIPQVNTVVTGFMYNDFYLDDSLVVIGLDYFYGSKSKYHPPKEYGYMLKRRESQYIVPSLSQMIALNQFVEVDPNDKTMLSEMITWGKVHYFMKRTMPSVPDSLIIMYPAEDMKEVKDNTDIIWSHFIEKNLFYKTDKQEIVRYTGETPKVTVIGDKCPGRIGRYLGWQIVKAYMDKNPDVTLPQLMKEKDVKKIFKLSKYKPKVK